MRRLALLAMAMSAPQPLLADPLGRDPNPRSAASLPCIQNVLPMTWRVGPRLRPDRVPPSAPQRRDLPRRSPCLRLATA